MRGRAPAVPDELPAADDLDRKSKIRRRLV